MFTDAKYKNADSIELLKNVYSKIKEIGYKINNIDSNIIAQAPKMMQHIPQMKSVLSNALEIDLEYISIKAKTKEHLDAIGEGKAIEAQAVVLIYKA